MTASELGNQYQRWIRDHRGILFKVARAYASSPDDQEDLLQEILLNLWSSIRKFRGEAKESTWIYRVSLQTAMVWRRSEKRFRKHQLNLADPHLVSEENLQSVENKSSEWIEALYAAIRQLPKIDASIALLHLDGLTYRDIAEVLGLSEGNIGVRLTRLRKKLSEHFDDPRRES